MTIGQFFGDGDGPGIFQKCEVLLFRIVKLIVPELLIAEDVNAKEVEGLTVGIIDLGDILDHRGGSLESPAPF